MPRYIIRDLCGAGLLLLSAPAMAQGADPEGVRAADGAAATFPVLAIDVSGVSQLPPSTVEKIVYPHLGPDRSAADVEAARKGIQDAYANLGFEAVLVEVPAQNESDFAAGLIRISVTEAPVADVAVIGARHQSAQALLRRLPSVQPGKPLNFKALQRELEVANRFPDREVEPSFDPGEQPGTLDVSLKVRDRSPFHASAELNNDNSPNTKSLRASGSASYSNMWGAGHTISFGYSVAPERRSDSEAYFGSYSLPFSGSPWTLVISGYKSNSDIAALGGTNVLGNGYQLGAQAIYRLDTARDYHAFRVGLDYKDFKQDIGLDGKTISDAPIRYLPLSLGYNFSAAREKWSLDFGLSSTLGLRVMKRIRCFDPDAAICIPEDQFTNREIDALENFAHLNLDATYTRSLPGDWVTQLRVSGQYADSHLVSNEQFAVGGLSTVRGYYQSEIVGDRGFAASIEIRGPSLATQIGTFVDELRLFAFADAALVSLIDPLPDTVSTNRIRSVGGGARLKLFGHLSGEALVGLPLDTTTDTKRRNARFLFLVKGEF